MSAEFDVERCRSRFPALARLQDGKPAVFLDGPAGSQVPDAVAAAVSSYLLQHNANGGGAFATSRESDAILDEGHRAVADLLGAPDPATVVFGPNMTTLTLSLARALTRVWKPGDEVVVTELEHDANYTPWVQAAEDAGATVQRAAIRKEDCTLDLEDMERKIGPRTRLVAVGAASNAVGTINPVPRIAEMAHRVGAELFVDAVHYAPHGFIDVAAWQCDYLVCSAYKFFGPHVGMLWGRRDLLERVPVYKLRPSSDDLPGRWMTGTQSHEGIAGTAAAVDYLASLGREQTVQGAGRREALQAAFDAIEGYERALVRRLLEGLGGLGGWRVWGISDPARDAARVPTVSITHERHTPAQVAEALGRRGIFVWSGNYYALPLTQALGLEPHGMVRIGLLHYNTAAEVDRLLEALDEIGKSDGSLG